MAYQRSLAVAAGCLAVLLVGCASSTPDAGARAARQDAQASAPQRAALRLQLASASDDPPLGWYSRHYEVKVACTTLCVAADGGDIAAEFTLALF